MGEMRVGEQITFIYCEDLKKTAAFYEGQLGLPLVLDQGGCRIVRVAEEGGGYLGYCQRPVEGSSREGVIITLVVSGKDGVDAWYRKLIDNNVHAPYKPKENPEYGIYHFFFQDPDGYTLEIQSFLDQNWNHLKERSLPGGFFPI